MQEVRNSRLRLEVTTLVVAAVVPALLWHNHLIATLSAFRPDIGWFAGLVPMLLMLAGVLCWLPVIRHHAQAADSRFYRSEPHAWQGWAAVLYILGFCLATQTAQLAHPGGAL